MAGFASEVSIPQSAEFFGRFGRFGGNMMLLKKLLADDNMMRTWVQSLIPIPSGPFIVPVDRSLSMPDMVRAGAYDNCEDAISSITEDRFPVDRSGPLQYEKELFLVGPSRVGITTTEWKAELDANGWELEETPELLALGAKYPDLQREYYIVAFGSSWSCSIGNLHSPALWSDNGKRRADSNWYSPKRRTGPRDRALVSRKRR